MKKKAEHPEMQYDDSEIISNETPVPAWLKWSYVFWLVLGLSAGVLYWNGSWGWLDRGYWEELQRAALTTFPYPKTQDTIEN